MQKNALKNISGILHFGYPEKYFRHIAFWLSWLFYLICNKWYNLYFNLDLTFTSGLQNPVLNVTIEFISEMLLVYFIVNFLVPKFYLKGKKSMFFLYLFIGILFTFFVYYQIQQKTSVNVFNNIWFNVGNFIGIGALFICTLFIGIKMMKNYYLKLEEKETLEKEKTYAEMQYLKARVHPHFLFNTLNNIYSFTLKKSPVAGSLVMQLYDTLAYMINDCEADLVPLEKELKMMGRLVRSQLRQQQEQKEQPLGTLPQKFDFSKLTEAA